MMLEFANSKLILFIFLIGFSFSEAFAQVGPVTDYLFYDYMWIIILAIVGTIIGISFAVHKYRNTKRLLKNTLGELDKVVKKESSTENILKEQNEQSLDILKERLAKGEITKEEYEEMKKVLK